MTEPYYADDLVTLYHGDCLDVLRDLPDASVDAVVTDPPYGLEFMGKAWDSFGADVRQRGDATFTSGDKRHGTVRFGLGQSYGGDTARSMRAFGEWCEQWATECLRVLKPGGHLLAFGGTRTWHRLACAIEDAGFEVRDSIAWLYGSGFPKSLDVSKAIDKAAGAEREVVDSFPRRGRSGGILGTEVDIVRELTSPATPDARRWQGWGTALKPAFEPVVVARKPLSGTVAANVLAHGTGALNIDATRIGTDDRFGGGARGTSGFVDGYEGGDGWSPGSPLGRWPANVVLDESQAAELDRQSGVLTSGSRRAGDYGLMGYMGADVAPMPDVVGDQGGASRFFYVAKAPTAERPRVKREGAGDGRTTFTGKVCTCTTCGGRFHSPREMTCGHDGYEYRPILDKPETADTIAHPTVKPLDLMRWLVRLVTPPGGVVLEPFAGSGTTAEACVIEGFRCIAIEREADYLPLIVQRLTKPIQPDLFGSLGGDVA